MVSVVLLASALLCWPASPWTVQTPVPRGGFGAADAFSRPVLLGWVGVAVAVLVTGSLVVLAGVAGGVASLCGCWTLTVLTRQHFAARRRRRALTDILAAARTFARELHAGAAPAVAADNGCAVSAGDGAAVLRALSQLMRADLRAETPRSTEPGVAARPVGTAVSAVSPARAPAVGPAQVGPWQDRRRIADGDAPTVDGLGANPAGESLKRLGTGWLLSRRHGVAFTPLIDALAEEIAQVLIGDARRAGEVAGPRMSGYVMAGLPVMGLLLGAGMGADPVGVLLGTSIGRVLLVVGVVLTCVGLLWSARIVAR